MNDIETCIERMEFDGIPDALMSLPRGSMGWQRVREKLEVEGYDFSNPVWDLDRVLYFMEDEGDPYFAKNPYNQHNPFLDGNKGTMQDGVPQSLTSSAVLPMAPTITITKADTTEYDRWFTTLEPNPKEYEIIQFNERTGRPTYNKNNMIRYLKDKRIVFDLGIPYMYDGQIYRPADILDIREIIHDANDCYGVPSLSENAVDDTIKKMEVSLRPKHIDIPQPFVTGEVLPGTLIGVRLSDYDGNCIPFKNGVFNVDTGVMLPFTPYIFFTRQMNTVLDPDVEDKDGEIEHIYRGIIPDPETYKFFWEMVGFIIFSPDLSPPSIFVTYGPGETGKSALMHAIASAIGWENISTLDLTQIGGSFTTAEMQGKILNVCGETGSGIDRNITRADGELLKRLSDGQPVTVQRKYGQPFEMRNTAKMWFISNTPPDFGETSSGLYRRLYIFPCRNKQRWEDQIYEKMQTENAKSWLMNRALEGWRRLKSNDMKFTLSEEMLEELGAYRTQDALMDYLEYTFGSLDPTAVSDGLDGTMVDDIYQDYRDYTCLAGGRPLSKRRFGEKLRNEFDMTSVKVRTIQADGRPTNRMKLCRK